MEAEAVVQADICLREFIQFYAEPCAPAGVDGFESVGDRFAEGLCIDEDDATEESVIEDLEPIFRFQVEVVLTSEPSLYIPTAHIAVSVGGSGRQQQIGRVAFQREIVEGPEGQDIFGACGKMPVCAGIELQALPIGVAA